MTPYIARVAALTALAIGSAGLATACSSSSSNEVDSTESSSALTGGEKSAYEYFVAKGLKNYQAAGIIGNLIQESNVNPDSVQQGGPGRGIAQWSEGGRWNADGHDNAVWYAGAHGESVYSLETQLDFVWYELTTFDGYGLSELKSSGNVSEATVAFQDRFEGCGDCEEGNRINYAKQVLSAYGGSSGGGSSGGSSYGSCTSTAGQAGTCIATSACAAKGGKSDPANLCPGSDDIQCCTTEETSSPYGSCRNTAGKSGTCISTSSCAAKGGSSDPADLCPGSADIQCCATEGSAGASYGSCRSLRGKAGTCIATSACAAQGGSSDPADLCPGPDNIQCCTH